MTDREQHDRNLEAYLDGSMSESERLAFEESLQSDGEKAAEVHLQKRIDSSLERLFVTSPPSEEQIQAMFTGASSSADPSTDSCAANDPTAPIGSPAIARKPSEPGSIGSATIDNPIARSRRWPWIAALAAAASMAGIVALLNLGDGRNRIPFFQPVPVARLYQDAVSNGFEPYYECRDDERFTAVFARRQGIPLRLKPMPAGSRMLGLSYPGGLSRNTTAMLCEVDGKPVMVFVDRADADLEIASARNDNSADVNVFRVVRNGLVFYEVTPFPSARVIEFLVVPRHTL